MQKLVSRGRLISLITFFLISGFFATNLISYNTAKTSLRQNIISSSLPLTRDNIYSEIQRDLMKPIFIASSMANDTYVRDWAISGEKDKESIQKYLHHILSKYGFFTAFFVSETTKNYYYHGGVLKQISAEDNHDVWYYNFTAKNEPYELTIDENQAAKNKLTIFINHRVYDYKHNLIGVTGVGLDLERITNLLSEYQVKYDREIYLVDKSGNVQVKSKNISFKEDNIYDVKGLNDFATALTETSQTSKNIEYDNGDVHYLLTARYIPELDWILFVVQNQDVVVHQLWLNFLRNMGLGLFITIIVILLTALSINFYQKKLEMIAATDHLTGTFNRREFARIFANMVEKSSRTSEELSVILFDIDNFKMINDRFGHVIGDRVISRISEITSACIRNTDMLARWGGDEFIIISLGGHESTVHIAERIMEYVRYDEILSSYTGDMKVTLSMGVAVYRDTDTEQTLTQRADKALYRAKESGRNRIESA